VRGADLLDSTGRQIALQRALGVATPQYAHLPVATNAQGEKLSKQTLARALDTTMPVQPLWDALRFLGQEPPDALRGDSLSGLWAWAHENWSLAQVPRTRAAFVSGFDASDQGLVFVSDELAGQGSDKSKG